MFFMLFAWTTGNSEAPAALFAEKTSNEVTKQVSYDDIFTLTAMFLIKLSIILLK